MQTAHNAKERKHTRHVFLDAAVPTARDMIERLQQKDGSVHVQKEKEKHLQDERTSNCVWTADDAKESKHTRHVFRAHPQDM